MSWLDNLIAFVSPEWGARRAAWRDAYEQIKNYDAGSSGRLNAGWRAVNDSAEMTDRYNRDVVRARARDLERNSDIMNSVTGAFKRNVIGNGFQLQAKTSEDALNKEIERLWRKWCKARNCDVTATQSLNQMLRMAVVRKKIDGGVLFVKRYTRDGMIPFSIQMVEVDELDGTQVEPRGGAGHRVVGGIEYNEYNRPVGYWIQQYQVDGFSLIQPVYVDAQDVIFYFTKKRPSQVREMSDMSQTVTRIRDVNEFITAVAVKQRIEACLSVFIKKALPVTGLGRQGTAPDRVDYDGKTLSPGMIRELNAGDDVQVVNPSGQSADAASFVKLQQRLVGAGQGLSYEATSRDMSQSNYSSARQGMIEDDMTFGEEREGILAVLDEIYESFLISCVLCGRVSIPGFWENLEAYLDHSWIRQPRRWIDPAKESAATKTALNTGVKTYKQIAAEEGADWRSQIDDMAEVLEYAKERGIDLGGVLFDGKLQQKEEAGPVPDEGDGQGDDEGSQDEAGGSGEENAGNPDEEPGAGQE